MKLLGTVTDLLGYTIVVYHFAKPVEALSSSLVGFQENENVAIQVMAIIGHLIQF